MRTKRISALLLGLSLIVFFATTSVRMSGQGGAAPAIDNDDIGGVVTGAQGPEAGVWVIAETRSTPTRLIKSVVTDDRGRYVVPGSAGRRIRRLGPRLRAGRFAESEIGAGQDRQPEGGRGARQEGGGAVLSRAVLVRAAAAAAEERFPRHG